MNNVKVEFTREKLYEDVWRKTMVLLPRSMAFLILACETFAKASKFRFRRKDIFYENGKAL